MVVFFIIDSSMDVNNENEIIQEQQEREENRMSYCKRTKKTRNQIDKTLLLKREIELI